MTLPSAPQGQSSPGNPLHLQLPRLFPKCPALLSRHRPPASPCQTTAASSLRAGFGVETALRSWVSALPPVRLAILLVNSLPGAEEWGSPGHLQISLGGQPLPPSLRHLDFSCKGWGRLLLHPRRLLSPGLQDTRRDDLPCA